MAKMSKRACPPLNILCIMLVAALFLSASFGVFPDHNEASLPLFSEHSHEGGVVHSHLEHPDGTVEYPQAFTSNGQERGRSLADGHVFGVRSRHGLPLERPPESFLLFS